MSQPSSNTNKFNIGDFVYDICPTSMVYHEKFVTGSRIVQIVARYSSDSINEIAYLLEKSNGLVEEKYLFKDRKEAYKNLIKMIENEMNMPERE